MADRGPVSRATIAAGTGLNKTTVSSLVAELIEIRLLAETGDDERPGNVGRPAQTVRLSGNGVASLGLEINIDYLATCARARRARVASRPTTRPGLLLRLSTATACS